jgi:hypothetical protein
LFKKVDRGQTAAALIGAAATPACGGAGVAQANSDSAIAIPVMTVIALALMIISQADWGGRLADSSAHCRSFVVDF